MNSKSVFITAVVLLCSSVVFQPSIASVPIAEDRDYDREQGIEYTLEPEWKMDPEKFLNRSAPRVAVIGGGIGGMTTAAFLRDLLGADAEIEVFEATRRLGGRAERLPFMGLNLEVGATVIHRLNHFLVGFAKALGLHVVPFSDPDSVLKNLEDGILKSSAYAAAPGSMNIWNGKEFVINEWEGVPDFVNTLKMLWNYGPVGMYKMDKATQNLLNGWLSYYEQFEKGLHFASFRDMATYSGGGHFTGISLETALRDPAYGIQASEKLIKELATAVSRDNYSQHANMTAFPGFISLSTSRDDLVLVAEGNQAIAEGLVDYADATVHLGAKVSKIYKYGVPAPGEGVPRLAYKIDTSKTGRDSTYELYDAVVIAAPAAKLVGETHESAHADWTTPVDSIPALEYQTCVVTVLTGTLRAKELFGVEESEVPDHVLTTAESPLPFTVLRRWAPAGAAENKQPIWRLFSHKVLTSAELNMIFGDSWSEANKVVRKWPAYPVYKPPVRFDIPTRLDERVWYNQGVEQIASAMEVSAVSAQNAALGVYHSLRATLKFELPDAPGLRADRLVPGLRVPMPAPKYAAAHPERFSTRPSSGSESDEHNNESEL